MRLHIEGEFVARDGTPAEQLVPRLERILCEELKLRFASNSPNRSEVIVVAGKYESKPLPGRQPNMIDLFAVIRAGLEAGGGSGTLTNS